MDERMNPPLSRRACLSSLAAAMVAWSATARAQASKTPFEQWVAAFRAPAHARGISDATYTRVMSTIKPDTAVFELNRYQPEFKEQLWQYLNRRVSDWRITTGKEKAKEYAPLLGRIEKDYGVDRGIMLGLWGSNPPSAIRMCRRTICGPSSRRSPPLPGASLGAALIGSKNCSTRSSSSSTAGAHPRRCAVPGPAPWAIPSGCRRCGSMSGSITTATAG